MSDSNDAELLETLDRARTTGDPIEIGTALAALGVRRAEEGSVATAVELIEEAIDLARRSGNKAAEAQHSGLKGGVLFDAGRLDEAESSLRLSLDLAGETDSLAVKGDVLATLGLVYWQSEQYLKASEVFSDALSLVEETGDVGLRLIAHERLAQASMLLDRPADAISHAQEAIEAMRAMGHRIPGSAVEETLVVALLREERYEHAVAAARDALGRAGVEPDSWKLTVSGYLADALYGAGDLEEAVRAYEQTRSLAAILGDEKVEARVGSRLGAVYADLGDLERSNELLTRSLELSRSFEDHHTVAEQLFLLALNARQQRDFDTGLGYASEAADLFEQMGAFDLAAGVGQLLRELEAG